MPAAVEKIIKEVMDRKLKRAKFDDAKCKQLALELCSEIKEKVKGLGLVIPLGLSPFPYQS